MSYLRDLCLFEHNGVLHIFCSVFLRRVTISRIVESGAKHHKPNHFPP
jgi:hypothetical protein